MSTAVEPPYAGVRALFVNCTLKPSPRPSNTQALMERAMSIMRSNGVEVDSSAPPITTWRRACSPDMTTEGAARDDWPALQRRVLDADILVLGTPIWLGDKSSVCTRVVERLYACSAEVNERGQSIYYGRVGGIVVTGNEDGIKHVAMNVLYSLQHLGGSPSRSCSSSRRPSRGSSGCSGCSPSS